MGFLIIRKSPKSSQSGFSPVSAQSMEPVLYEYSKTRRQCPHGNLATSWEILLAASSSLVTSAYTLHHEKRVCIPYLHYIWSCPTDRFKQGISHADPELAFDPGHFSFFLNPSPAVLLGSCLILGCSISSFAYRHQENDKYQTPIFVVAIAAVSIFGFALGINVNLIMLGLFPWALCIAMILSTCVHCLARYCRRRKSYVVCGLDEKGVLLEC